MEPDIIISGGGYGGLAAAKVFAERGWGDRVIVLDRRPRAGYPPASTSGIALYWLKRYGLLPKVESVSAKVNSLRLISPSGRERVFGISNGTGDLFGSAALVLDEPDFCGRIEREAQAEGVEFRHLETGQDIRPVLPFNFTRGREYYEVDVLDKDKRPYSLLAKYVVAADGYDSRLGRRMGLTQPLPPESQHRGYEITVPSTPHDKRDEITMWFGQEVAKQGYVWSFPAMENGLPMRRVGIGTPLSVPTPPITYFKKFLESHPWYDVKPHHRMGGQIPTYKPPRHLRRGNFLLVGDAARCCDSTTGGGVQTAIITGHEAAECIASGRPQDYEGRVRFVTKELRIRYILKQALYTLSDAEIERFVEVMASYPIPDSENLDPFAERRKVTKYFLKRVPGLALRIPFRGRNWEMVKTFAGF